MFHPLSTVRYLLPKLKLSFSVQSLLQELLELSQLTPRSKGFMSAASWMLNVSATCPVFVYMWIWVFFMYV